MNTKPTAATGIVCSPERFHFPAVKKRTLSASFCGGDVTSDGGPAFLVQDSKELELDGVSTGKPLAGTPVIRLGRCDGASKYAGQLLQAKRFIGWSAGSSFARPGLRWT